MENEGRILPVRKGGEFCYPIRLEQDFDENWYYAGTGLHPRPGDTVYLDYSA